MLDQKKEEFDAKVKWFQDAIECENDYLAQLEQHISFLMADHQHHFVQRHMLLSTLSSMISPLVQSEDYFVPEQIEFDE